MFYVRYLYFLRFKAPPVLIACFCLRKTVRDDRIASICYYHTVRITTIRQHNEYNRSLIILERAPTRCGLYSRREQLNYRGPNEAHATRRRNARDKTRGKAHSLRKYTLHVYRVYSIALVNASIVFLVASSRPITRATLFYNNNILLLFIGLFISRTSAQLYSIQRSGVWTVVPFQRFFIFYTAKKILLKKSFVIFSFLLSYWHHTFELQYLQRLNFGPA